MLDGTDRRAAIATPEISVITLLCTHSNTVTTARHAVRGLAIAGPSILPSTVGIAAVTRLRIPVVTCLFARDLAIATRRSADGGVIVDIADVPVLDEARGRAAVVVVVLSIVTLLRCSTRPVTAVGTADRRLSHASVSALHEAIFRAPITIVLIVVIALLAHLWVNRAIAARAARATAIDRAPINACHGLSRDRTTHAVAPVLREGARRAAVHERLTARGCAGGVRAGAQPNHPLRVVRRVGATDRTPARRWDSVVAILAGRTGTGRQVARGTIRAGSIILALFAILQDAVVAHRSRTRRAGGP